MRFNTFNEVAKWYEATKPIVSKDHKAEDNIRPIGQRKRKWERIRKLNAETYLLLDGNYCHSLHNKSVGGDGQYEQDMAAIMWKREADGDYIYIRNGMVGSAPITRFNFFITYLPTGVIFAYNKQGEHWVHAKTSTGYTGYTGYTRFFLPKTRYEFDSQRKEVINDDGKRLKFRVNEDGTFTRAGDTFLAVTTTINKELKKQWKTKVEAFYRQAAALAPMLDTTWNGRHEYKRIITDWSKENKISISYLRTVRQIPSTLARAIVEEVDHPLRIPMMAMVICEIDGKRPIVSKANLSDIKSAYNRLMNKALSMYTTKEV